MDKFWSNCGKELESTDNACSNCGTLVNPSVQPNYRNNMNYNNQMMMPQPMINHQNMYYQNMAFPNNMNYGNYNIQYSRKKIKNGFNTSGLILCSICLVICAFIIIYFITLR